jgi:hypothetical protein
MLPPLSNCLSTRNAKRKAVGGSRDDDDVKNSRKEIFNSEGDVQEKSLNFELVVLQSILVLSSTPFSSITFHIYNILHYEKSWRELLAYLNILFRKSHIRQHISINRIFSVNITIHIIIAYK